MYFGNIVIGVEELVWSGVGAAMELGSMSKNGLFTFSFACTSCGYHCSFCAAQCSSLYKLKAYGKAGREERIMLEASLLKLNFFFS